MKRFRHLINLTILPTSLLVIWWDLRMWPTSSQHWMHALLLTLYGVVVLGQLAKVGEFLASAEKIWTEVWVPEVAKSFSRTTYTWRFVYCLLIWIWNGGEAKHSIARAWRGCSSDYKWS